ncbi:MAG: PTS glucose transporter subunit IIA [Clostridia bacterium]|nr:PTS glucose transporter subunit IIA [Clostridia bacterium]
MLFQKKKKTLLAVADGVAVPLSAVPDEAFSSGMLGQGFAVKPTAGTVYAPIDGKVESVSDTRHAYTLLSDDGLDVLVHVGIDTVELKGEGFLSMVSVGDRVKAGDVLARADLDLIREKGFKTVIPVLVTNPEKMNVTDTVYTETVGGKTEILHYRLA